MIAIIYFIVLRIITDLAVTLIAFMAPQAQPYVQRVLQVVPIPLLVLLIPIVLAMIIIWINQVVRPEKPQDHEKSTGLLPSFFTTQQLMKVLMFVTFLWLAIFVLQLVIWFSFSQLHHS